MIAINLIVVSQEEGLYEKVVKELADEHIRPGVVRAGSIRETVETLGRGESCVVALTENRPKEIQPSDAVEDVFSDACTPVRGNIEDELNFIRMYVRTHLSESLDLRIIAGEVGLTSNYLCSLFRKHEGISLQKFIEKERLGRAAYLLETENTTVSEIAGRTGYKTSSYFCKIFRKHYGETPLQYRRHNRRNLLSGRVQ